MDARGTRSRGIEDPAELITVDEVRDRILSSCAPLPAVSLPILETLGMVLAEDVFASDPVPPFANSAMDGFAVRSVDVAIASSGQPMRLTLAGEAAAGHPCATRLRAGEAIRIMTGAPVPDGADAVVRFEDTDEGERSNGTIGIYRAAVPGANIRPAGEDVAAGSLVLRSGTPVRPAEIGMLATLGRESVLVHGRPRVAILSTGDEIVDPGAPLGPGQIRNSNGATIAAMTLRSGGEPVILGVARDTGDDVRAKLRSSPPVDLLISTGGVSVGDYDVVKRVLQSEGKIEIWQVRLKPGKPLAFGSMGGVPFLGLPGNPVAAAVGFEQFARPMVRTMLGHANIEIPRVEARLLTPIENKGGRRNFVRVRVERHGDEYVASLSGQQGSGILSALVAGNGLAIVPENVNIVESGSMVTVQMLDWCLD